MGVIFCLKCSFPSPLVSTGGEFHAFTVHGLNESCRAFVDVLGSDEFCDVLRVQLVLSAVVLGTSSHSIVEVICFFILQKSISVFFFFQLVTPSQCQRIVCRVLFLFLHLYGPHSHSLDCFQLVSLIIIAIVPQNCSIFQCRPTCYI